MPSIYDKVSQLFYLPAILLNVALFVSAPVKKWGIQEQMDRIGWN